MERLNTIEAAGTHRQNFYCPQCKSVLREMVGKYFCQNCAHSYPIIADIPSFVDRNVAIDSFDAAAFEFLFEMEQRHFWHIGRREIIMDILKRNIPDLAKSTMLEIGCGNGSVLAYLKQNGVDIEGGDIYLEGLKLCQRRAGSVDLYHVDILALPFYDDFDVIGVFDVLEHIDDDEKALLEISQALKSRGKMMLTVPAHKFLWSYFDVQSHHVRRYSKKELVAKLERNGFTVRKASFYMFFLFPLFALFRLIGNALQEDEKQNIETSLEVRTIPMVNRLFLGLMRVEKWLIRYLSLPFGTSLIVLAEKR